MQKTKKGVKKTSKAVSNTAKVVRTKKVAKKADRRKVLLTILYALAALNVVLLVVLFITMYNNDKEVSDYKKQIENHEKILQSMNTNVATDDEGWMDLLQSKKNLRFTIPEDWKIESSEASYCTEHMEDCGNEEFEILLKVGSITTYETFTNGIFASANNVDSSGKLESYDPEGAYFYEVASFEEARDGIIYYDESNAETGELIRHEIKVTRDEVANQVKVEIDNN